MRLKLTIEYAGTRYSGWQVQDNARTVQGVLGQAIHEITGEDRFEFQGSGRTDAGVHALGQVAHLDLQRTVATDWLQRRVNDVLPSDVNILSVDSVHRGFHARHHATARSYLYQIARRRTAFAKPWVWWVKEPLDVGRMRTAAGAFVGFHDFRTFTQDADGERSTEVLIETLDVHDDDDLVIVHVEASHFLWKMVRRLVGVLVEVGRGEMQPEEAAALLTSASPVPARVTAPASGLFLERVFYPGDDRTPALRPPITLRHR